MDLSPFTLPPLHSSLFLLLFPPLSSHIQTCQLQPSRLPPSFVSFSPLFCLPSPSVYDSLSPPLNTFRRSVLWHDSSSPCSLRCGLRIIRCVKEWQSLPALPPSCGSRGGRSNQNTGIEWGWSFKQRVTLLIEWTRWPGHHYCCHLVWSKFGFYVQTHYFSNRDCLNL